MRSTPLTTLEGLTEAEFDAIHNAHFAPRRHGDSKLEQQPPAAELVRTWNAAHAATGIGEEEREPPPSAWDRWSLRAAAWATPARFWSIYLAVLAAGVALALWLRS